MDGSAQASGGERARRGLSAARRRLVGLRGLDPHLAAVDRRLTELEQRVDHLTPAGHSPPEETPPGGGDDRGSAAPTPSSQTLDLDYPVEPSPRWGWGSDVHPELRRIIDERRSQYADVLRACLDHHEDYCRISVEPGPDVTQPSWRNGFLPALDAMMLYSELVRHQPAVYIEVGSGNSTKFARRAIRDHDLRTRIVSVDPSPRAECDALCDEVIREPLERADLSIFSSARSGDVVFLDGSHRVFTNSDTAAFFLEVMPRLASGTLVQIHDIFLPYDYPPEWNDRFYSEQYLLAAWLLAGGQEYAVHAANYFISMDDELHSLLRPLWEDPRLAGAETHGGSFWLRRT